MTEAEEHQVDAAIAAEIETLSIACRRDARRLDAFLAPEFHEFQASGGEIGRAGTADRVAAQTAEDPTPIRTERMVGRLLADGLVIVTYRAVRGGRRSNRTSIWRRAATGDWLMLHHQGTPVPEDAA